MTWRRELDGFAVVTLVFLVITAVVPLVGAHSARALLIKDSAAPELLGLLCPARQTGGPVRGARRAPGPVC
ncbi:hypothetical protein [Streptomyces sp. NPDC058728]|uniref:hypothetical protein n=1 Tax=Streptomyces sp. NPDC058728 TaxID=3346612 RepID=UPI003676D37A